MQNTKKTIIAVIVLAGVFGLSVLTVRAANSDNRTNNGIVKINNENAPDKIPSSHPRVSCNFTIDFFNYDKSDDKATVTFELQSPTNSKDHTLKAGGGNLTPTIGGDAAGGDKDRDASEKYALSFTGNPDKQGYHVKVTVNAPGSKGEDKKQKVFWVDACTTQVQGTQTRSDLPHTGANLAAAIGVSSFVAIGGYLTAYWRQSRKVRG